MSVRIISSHFVSSDLVLAELGVLWTTQLAVAATGQNEWKMFWLLVAAMANWVSTQRTLFRLNEVRWDKMRWHEGFKRFFHTLKIQHLLSVVLFIFFILVIK